MGTKGIYGLSGSGLDVESLVKTSMLSRQNKYDNMFKKATRKEWIKSAYSKVYNKLFDYQNSLSKYKLSSATKAMSATSSNEAMSATANADALQMAHTVKVESVASNAYAISSRPITRVASMGGFSNKLVDSVYADEISDRNGSDIALSFDVSDGNATGTVTFTYKELSDGASFNTLATKIKRLGLNVTASYDAVNDSFSLYNTESGASNNISITARNEDSATFLNNLNLAQSSNGILSEDKQFEVNKAVTMSGTDSIVNIDGKNYNVSSNKLQVDGVTYNFEKMKAGDTATVNVTQDNNKIIDNVKSFVKEYNEMLDYLNNLYNEEDYGFMPLTDNERAEMKEAQITQWEEKAKSGLLNHSSYISSIISSMRESIYERVGDIDGKYNSLSAIGITSSDTKGHLVIDEEKLKNALNDDSSSVYNLFAGAGDDSVANRLYYKSISNGMSKIKSYAGISTDVSDQSFMGKEITSLKDKMETYRVQMSAYQESLYVKYDRLERLIVQMSAQLSAMGLGNQG